MGKNNSGGEVCRKGLMIREESVTGRNDSKGKGVLEKELMKREESVKGRN